MMRVLYHLADAGLRAENRRLRDRNLDLRLRLRRWEKAYQRAEKYFDGVNEPDELWEFDDRLEARARGAAGYRARIRTALPEQGVAK